MTKKFFAVLLLLWAVGSQLSALSRKMIVNGELLIFRDNHIYTALGVQVK